MPQFRGKEHGRKLPASCLFFFLKKVFLGGFIDVLADRIFMILRQGGAKETHVRNGRSPKGLRTMTQGSKGPRYPSVCLQ